MKQHSFYSLVMEGHRKTARLQQGYTDGQYNYYKQQRGSLWFAIHPVFGLSIATGTTRAEAAAMAHSEHIKNALRDFSQQHYNKLQTEFENHVKKAKAA